MGDLDELEDIRLYHEAKASDEPSIPIDEAFNMIESSWSSLVVEDQIVISPAKDLKKNPE